MLAAVASLTSANRIKRRAGEYGIISSVIQTPQSLSREGCGYSLRFDSSAKQRIISCARELNIKIRAFFDETVVDGQKKYNKIQGDLSDLS